MKKLVSLLLVTAMLLSCFAACGEKPGTNGSDNSNGGNSNTDAKVGDVLDAPEKTISLDDIQELTITTIVSLPASGLVQMRIDSVSNKNGCVRFYEKSIKF